VVAVGQYLQAQNLQAQYLQAQNIKKARNFLAFFFIQFF